jgi:uncharacterized protein (TIGR00369 family)
MDAAGWERLRRDFVQGFIAHLGVEALEAAAGRWTSALQLGPQHKQQDGFVHAGVMASLADHSGGYAAYTLLDESLRVLTIEFKINFFRPARGQRLICRSQVIHQGRTILVAASDVGVVDGSAEKTVARATITLMAVPAHNLRASGSVAAT